MAIRVLAAALLLGMLAGSGLAAEPARAPTVKTPAPPGPPKVSVTLLGEGASIEPGGSFWVGLRQRIAPGWHTYWTNPGDSGEPPTLDWALPAGWQAGPLVFPQPERMPVGPLMSYGYTREVVLLTRLTAPSDLAAGVPVTLRAHAAWLVCEKICIPEESGRDADASGRRGPPRAGRRGRRDRAGPARGAGAEPVAGLDARDSRDGDGVGRPRPDSSPAASPRSCSSPAAGASWTTRPLRK